MREGLCQVTCNLLLLHPPLVFCQKILLCLDNFSSFLVFNRPFARGYIIIYNFTLIITGGSFVILDFKMFLCFIIRTLKPTPRGVSP